MNVPKLVSCSVWNDWEGVLMPWTVHWVDFTFATLKGEYDKRFGNVELHVAVLGVHFRIVIKVADGDLELQADIERMLKAINNGDSQL